MANSRLETLKSMVEQDPKNTFSRYGLAMEYVNAGDNAAAVEHFRALIANTPSYAAAYFHGGQTLEKMGQTDDAKVLYRAGIEVTSASGDAHARSELQAALASLG